MAGRVQRKGGARQAVRLFVVGAGRKPVRQRPEVGRPVTAPAAAFVDRGHCGQQLRNGGAGPRAQQFGLRRLKTISAALQEPAAQAFPALAPGAPAAALFVGALCLVAGCGVAGLAFGHPQQHRVDARAQARDELGDGFRALHQVAHKTLQVVDQARLVGQHGRLFGALQFQ